MDLLSDDALDAAYLAFQRHSNAQSFLASSTCKFVCEECGERLADWTAYHRHSARQAILAAHRVAFPTGSVGS